MMLFWLGIRWAVATVLVIVAIGFAVLAACNGPVEVHTQKCVQPNVTAPPPGQPAPNGSPYCVG